MTDGHKFGWLEWKGCSRAAILRPVPLLMISVLMFAAHAAVTVGQSGVRSGGQEILSRIAPGTKAVALFFVASDCPISDRTFPEMKRLREIFTPRGVRVLFVYPNSTERPADVEAHQHAFDPDGEAVFDPGGDFAHLTRAKVTPEVSVLVPDGVNWIIAYTGRIDDRFVHLGTERPRPTQFFAEDALNAVLSGRPVPKPTGTPVGCAIVSAANLPERSGGSR